MDNRLKAGNVAGEGLAHEVRRRGAERLIGPSGVLGRRPPSRAYRTPGNWDKLGGCVMLVLSLAATGCQRHTAPAVAYNEASARELRALLQAGQQATEGVGEVSAAEPTGWATLKGRFTLNGTPPPRSPLNVDKDQEVCAPAGKPPLSEDVVIGPGNGIKNVLVFLSSTIPAEDPKWVHETYLATKDAVVEFDQKNCIFLSHVAAMRATQTMKVLNSDPVGHNTNLDSKRGAAPANMTIAANGFQMYVPGKPSPAPFGVSCSIHPWMKSWLMVADSPYFAVTKEDGSFEIANVPAGVPLEFRVWQEKLTFVQSVTMDGQATKWSKGRFTVTLGDSETKELNVVLDGALFQ